MTKQYHKGSAIAYALMVISAVSILLLSLMLFVTSRAKNAYRSEIDQEAFQVAEAGANWYRWYLAHETDGKTAAEVQAFWKSTNPAPYGIKETFYQDFKDAEGDVVGRYSISLTTPSDSTTIVTATITGWTYKNQNVKKEIRLRFRRPTWSDYAILTNAYSHFDANWNIKGKIMSNTGVHFDGVANNVVSSGSQTYYDPEEKVTKPGVWTSWDSEFNTTQNNSVFLGGKKFPVAQKDFTGVAVDLGMMKSESQQPNGTTINNCTQTGCYFDTQMLGRHIVLNSNGTFTITVVSGIVNNSNSIKTEKNSATFAIPDNGLIFINSDVWVEGTINNKKVTIVAANIPATGTDANIYIGADNLLYTNFDGKDVVGLIAQGNIEFTTDGPADLVIDGALLAKNGGVMKKDYNPNCCGGGCEAKKNSLGIFGSVASNQTLVFTVTKACNNTKAVGFQSKQITYDNQLLYYPPPYFPSDVEYTLDNWEQR